MDWTAPAICTGAVQGGTRTQARFFVFEPQRLVRNIQLLRVTTVERAAAEASAPLTVSESSRPFR